MPEQPKSNETREDFIARCVKIYKDEGLEEEKATATCEAIWEKNGNEESELKDLVASVINTITGAAKAGLKKVNLMNADEVPQKGIIRRLRIQENFVEALITGLSEETKEYIRNNEFGRLSVEIGASTNVAVKAPVLHRVALLGGTVQAEPTAKLNETNLEGGWHRILKIGATYMSTSGQEIPITDVYANDLVTNTNEAIDLLGRYPSLTLGHTPAGQQAEYVKANDIDELIILNDMKRESDMEERKQLQKKIEKLEAEKQELVLQDQRSKLNSIVENGKIPPGVAKNLTALNERLIGGSLKLNDAEVNAVEFMKNLVKSIEATSMKLGDDYNTDNEPEKSIDELVKENMEA